MKSPQLILLKFLTAAVAKLGVSKHVYVVGGAVRNFVLKEPIKDVDLVIDAQALKGKDAEWLANKLQGLIPAYTTMKVSKLLVVVLAISGDWELDGVQMKGETIDIATAREETYSETGHGKPVDVKPVSIEKDVYRREFTFNTLMWRMADLASGHDKAEIIDITGCGMADLKAGRMACPSDPDKTFNDDPSRMLRAVKFLVRYGFHIPTDVADSIRRNAVKLKKAKQEVIALLLMGDILKKSNAVASLKTMKDLGLLAVVNDMLGSDQPFGSTLSNWSATQDVGFLIDLLDSGLMLDTPLKFLTSSEKDRVRVVAAGLSVPEAHELIAVLKQPTRAIADKSFMPQLAAEQGVSPKNMGPMAAKVNAAIKAAILDKPELLKQPDTLKEIARASVTESVVSRRSDLSSKILEIRTVLVS